MRVLIVEDDADLARGLRFNLEHEGYQVQVAPDARSAREALAGELDLVLLDLGLPDADGLDLLRELRAAGRDLPVVCLTARGQETDVVMGLGLGADDYVVKPFGLAELLARMQAVLRRVRPGERETVRLGEVQVDLGARRAVHPDRTEELTPIETDLLRYLLQHRGVALERQQILRDLWGLDTHFTTRTLDNHVARLRRKIEQDGSRPCHLVTVHGVGYRLEGERSVQDRDRDSGSGEVS